MDTGHLSESAIMFYSILIQMGFQLFFQNLTLVAITHKPNSFSISAFLLFSHGLTCFLASSSRRITSSSSGCRQGLRNQSSFVTSLSRCKALFSSDTVFSNLSLVSRLSSRSLVLRANCFSILSFRSQDRSIWTSEVSSIIFSSLRASS